MPTDASASKTEQEQHRRVAQVLNTVAGHNFHPVDEDSFTIDRNLRTHGIADLDDDDWRVRL
ncbi:MAG: hypothetical protein RQ826_14415, partial [Xanthomonadales bacterium]|nr:hypothetical protein [Xanthomonadales bacterium]